MIASSCQKPIRYVGCIFILLNDNRVICNLVAAVKDSRLGESQLAGGDLCSRLFTSMAELQLFTKMLRYVIKWGIFWRTKQSGPIPRDERGEPLFFFFLRAKCLNLFITPSCEHFDHHGKKIKNSATIILQQMSPIWQPVFSGHVPSCAYSDRCFIS